MNRANQFAAVIQDEKPCVRIRARRPVHRFDGGVQLQAEHRVRVGEFDVGNPGIDKLEFELLSLAVSAVNGCGMCVTAHERKLREGGTSREAIQSAVRIASVMHAVAGVLEYQAAA